MNDIEFISKYPELFEEKSWQEEDGTTKTATRWKGILNGISFDYNGKTITETDSGNNIIKHHE